LTPNADGPEVAVEAMASGAIVHPCVSFLILHFAKNVALEQRMSGKVIFPPKEQDPVFNLDSLMCFKPW